MSRRDFATAQFSAHAHPSDKLVRLLAKLKQENNIVNGP